MSPRLRRPRGRTILLAIVALVVVAVAAGAWYVQPQPLLPEAGAALGPTPTVAFTEAAGRLEWSPASEAYTTGLVIYPGAKVPAAGYGPVAQSIAGQGYLVIIVEMPLNFAVLGIDTAAPAMAAHPEVQRWAIGGHSLGGAMAAQFVSGHPRGTQGLVLWASYSAADISRSGLKVASIYGTLDAGAAKITEPATKALLPSDTVYTAIDGGNHEQMGWYTGQPNDPPATISRADQQARVVTATVDLLGRIAPTASLAAPRTASRCRARAGRRARAASA